MERNRRIKLSRNLVYVTAFAFITLISLFYKLFLSGTFDGLPQGGNTDEPMVIRADENDAVSTSRETDECSEIASYEEIISVYICGAVNVPGVYEVSAGSIVNDVVVMAGGLTEDAAAERIDLVYILQVNMSIYIPYSGEEYDSSPLIRSGDQMLWGEGVQQATGAEGASQLVNLNTASMEQLMSLPGIGEVTARAIMDYREATPFARIEDVMNVTGIGEAKYDAIRELICV